MWRGGKPTRRSRGSWVWRNGPVANHRAHLSHKLGVGNAADLVRKLGADRPAWARIGTRHPRRRRGVDGGAFVTRS